MEKKKCFLRLGISVIIIMQLLSLLTVSVSASSNDETVLENETTNITNSDNVESIDETLTDDNPKLTYTIESEKVLSNEVVKVAFDKTGVTDYYYVADGVTVNEIIDRDIDGDGSTSTYVLSPTAVCVQGQLLWEDDDII